MPAKNATKAANIYAALYGGELTLGFDCVGVTICRFALCSIMPPSGNEECTYHEYGSCLSPGAKYASLETLRNMLTKKMRDIIDGQ